MKKRVFVLSRHSLFGQGIEALLSQADGVEIVIPETDINTAVECIQHNRPDVVILNCDDPEPDLTPAVLCIIRERLGISVIGLSLKDNKISIYRGEQKQVCQLEDLLGAICN